MIQTTVQMSQSNVEKLYNINYKGIQLNKKPMSWERARDYQNETIRNYGYSPNIKVHKNYSH